MNIHRIATIGTTFALATATAGSASAHSQHFLPTNQNQPTRSVNGLSPSPRSTGPEDPRPPFVDPTVPAGSFCKVPNLVGLNINVSYQEVADLVTAANCTIQNEIKTDPTSSELFGTIIAQSPVAGSIILKIDGISIDMSTNRH